MCIAPHKVDEGFCSCTGKMVVSYMDSIDAQVHCRREGGKCHLPGFEPQKQAQQTSRARRTIATCY